ncbi:macro domain-containing protein [Streptomyces niveus]|uniref:macro domain-containing protein n=1 Tax=Streptomyces niveus TaxID=193462 RepID=UPI0013319859|nr:macro domain-containing protein [Streptomyces niveus]
MNASVAFAAASGLVQLILTVTSVEVLQGWEALVVLFGASALWGVVKSIPKESVSREFRNPPFKVTVKTGDLFAEQTQLVIGFTDTFDTAVGNREPIFEQSVQAQFAARLYAGDISLLDDELNVALQDKSIESIESPVVKPKGKLGRYPIGTTVVIGGERSCYCVAYSKMGNDLVARSSIDFLWSGLHQLWGEISIKGHRMPVAMPVVGSGLAKLDNVDYQGLVKFVITSFVSHSRDAVVAGELIIVVHPQDSEKVDMNEVQAFLNSL